MTTFGLPLGRRLAVARGFTGNLVVFSPLEASERTLAELRSLGEIDAFIVPSRFHDRYYPGYFPHFPRAAFLAGPASLTDHPDWPLQSIFEPRTELTGFRSALMKGMPKVQEYVFFQEATRTLIIADLFFNLPDNQGWLTRMLLEMAGMGGTPRPSRLWRSCIKNPSEFTSSLKAVRAWDFDRIMPGHGEIIETGGKHVFEEAFREWLTSP